MGWLLNIPGIKAWLGAGAALIVAAMIGLFVWQGHEIGSLRKDLQAAEKTAKDAVATEKVISGVRDQELKNQKEAKNRANQIRQTPAHEDGAIAPVLRATLDRL